MCDRFDNGFDVYTILCSTASFSNCNLFEFLFQLCVCVRAYVYTFVCAAGARALRHNVNAFNLFVPVRMLFLQSPLFMSLFYMKFSSASEIQLEMRTEYLHDSIRNEMHDGFIPTIEQIERFYLLLTVKCIVLLHGTFSLTLTPTSHSLSHAPLLFLLFFSSSSSFTRTSCS